MGLKFKIAYNTIAQIVGKVISASATLLITALVTRKLGVSGYGDFTKIMTYVALFYMVSDFGMNAIFLQDKNNLNKNFSNLITLRSVWSIILIFLSLAILSFLPYDNLTDRGFSSIVKLGIIVGSITILTQGLITSANAIFQKFLRYDFSVIASSLGSLSTLIIIYLSTQKIMESFTKPGVNFIVFSYVVGGVIMVLISLILVKKLIGKYSLSLDLNYWRKLFLLSLPLGITLIFNLVYFRIDTFILSIYRSSEEVGLYGLAYKFFETILVLPTFFMNAVYPLMIERYDLGREQLRRFLIKNLKLLVIGSIIITISTFIISDSLINLVSGSNFSGSIIALKILSLSLPLFFLSSLFMWILIVIKKQTLLVFFYGLSMILNIVLNLIFIPKYGFIAAAITTGITEAFILLLTGYQGYKFLYEKKS